VDRVAALSRDCCCLVGVKVVTSRLGRSGTAHSPAGSSASEACSAGSDEPETIQWKRGNVLGKGAYGTVSKLWYSSCRVLAIGAVVLCRVIACNSSAIIAQVF